MLNKIWSGAKGLFHREDLPPEDNSADNLVSSLSSSNRIVWGSFETFHYTMESSFGGAAGLTEEIRIRKDRLASEIEGSDIARVLSLEIKTLATMLRLLRWWKIWKPRIPALNKLFLEGDETVPGGSEKILKWMRTRGKALRALSRVLNPSDV